MEEHELEGSTSKVSEEKMEPVRNAMRWQMAMCSLIWSFSHNITNLEEKDKNHQVLIVFLLQERKPLPGPESGLVFNTQKWIVQGDTHAEKARDFIGKERQGRELQGKGTQEDCSVTWFTASGFMVMWLISRLSLANHSDSGSFLVLLSQDTFQWGGFWEVVGHMDWHLLSPFDLSWILPVVVAC